MYMQIRTNAIFFMKNGWKYNLKNRAKRTLHASALCRAVHFVSLEAPDNTFDMFYFLLMVLAAVLAISFETESGERRLIRFFIVIFIPVLLAPFLFRYTW